MIAAVNYILTTVVLIIHICLLLSLLLFIYVRLTGRKLKFVKNITTFIGANAYYLAFSVSLLAVMTSLFWSEIMKFTPCILCWYQRIFMYPQPFLLYTAIVRNERVLKPYLLLMSGLGLMIGLYHHAMQLFPKNLALPCQAIGGVSCITGYKFYYGYITYPLMAATAFTLIILFLSLSKKSVR